MKAFDRVIRADLYESERFIDLPSDTHRLIFIALVNAADDFGNLEAHERRLWRWIHNFCQVKSPEQLLTILSTLCDADLLRRYELDDKAFFHIPRFRSSRSYTKRYAPPSPWCDTNAPTGQIRLSHNREQYSSKYMGKVQVEQKQLPAPKADTDLQQVSDRPVTSLTPGEGVGVGKLQACVDPKPGLDPDQDQVETAKPPNSNRGTRLPRDWQASDMQVQWALQYLQPLGIPATRGAVLRVADGFKDYWHSKPGAGGLKTDWNKAWQMWVRNENWIKYLGKTAPGQDPAGRMDRAV